MASLVGSRVESKEDNIFVNGKGRYSADINSQPDPCNFIDHPMQSQN